MDKNDGWNKKVIFLLLPLCFRVCSAEPLSIGTVQISDGIGT